jgi:NAD(P)H dehydrogenase (quinone)
MTETVIIYFSGYGHTAKQAEAVHKGAASVAGTTASLIAIDKEGNISDADWQKLENADAIIFGSPTYMGNVAWQFKKFADNSSKVWGAQKWKNKVAAGFTNSATINGDKFSTINYLFTLSMQHSMVWIGTGLTASNKKDAKRDDVNWLGGYAGALAQSPADSSPEEGPLPGDLETARLLGVRIAEFAKKLASAK